MGEFRSPGTTSSSVDRERGLAILRARAETPALKKILSLLGSDADLHIVGGVVRESLAGDLQTDLDLATKLPPDEVRARLAKGGVRVIETGIAHGTVTALLDDETIEITTFRVAGARSGSAFAKTIETDLRGRDFTINAVAFSLQTAELVDPLGGLADLIANLLRAVGDAASRFAEDPLRILRMVRFGPAAGRLLDPATRVAAQQAAASLSSVSRERIRVELEKILLGSHVGDGLRALRDLGLLQYTVPELVEGVGLEQNEFHVEDVFSHTVTVVENAPAKLRLRLAALFHDIGKPRTLSTDVSGNRHFYNHEKVGYEICKERMEHLRFSHDETQAVSELVRLHMRPLDCGPAGVRRLMRDLGDLLEDWKDLKRADSPPVLERDAFEERLRAFETLLQSERDRLQRKNFRILAINGDDLIAAGFQPGRELGAVLKALDELVIEDPDLNERAVLLARAAAMRTSGKHRDGP